MHDEPMEGGGLYGSHAKCDDGEVWGNVRFAEQTLFLGHRQAIAIASEPDTKNTRQGAHQACRRPLLYYSVTMGPHLYSLGMTKVLAGSGG